MRGKETKAPSPVKILPAEAQGKEPNYFIDIVVVRLIDVILTDMVVMIDAAETQVVTGFAKKSADKLNKAVS